MTWVTRIVSVVAGGLVAALLSPSRVLANPFTTGKPGAAGTASDGMFTMPFMQDIMVWQKQIHDAMSTQVEALQSGESLAPLWGMLGISFLYGVFHVLAPGHGKVIVSSYFLGNHARWKDGIIAGLIMAVGHTVTAVALVVGLYFLLGVAQLGVLEHARYVELLGYGMIAGVGVWLLLRAVRGETAACGCGHNHAPGHAHHHTHEQHIHVPVHKNSRALSLFTATSLVPCTGSMILLFFALANNVLWVGVLGVVAIALGMWVTVTAIGVATILTRHLIVGDAGTQGVWRRRIMRGLGVFAALVVTVTGSLLFAGVWQSMGE
ncbi:MAG: hypothetical protein WBK91_10765 [Alphaproteobacteria bacterium]